MNIITIDYSMATQSLDIFFSGCAMGSHCPGCHNSEAWDFSVGTPWLDWASKIQYNLREFDGMIKRVFFLGGEPLDQDARELRNFLDEIDWYEKELWLFTRYDLGQVPEDLMERFDYIKTGPYLESLATTDNISYGVRLATSNQKVNKRGVEYLT